MNPFSLPTSDPELYLRREEQRSVDRAVTAEQRLIPVHLRKSTRQYQMLEELRTVITPKASTFQQSRRSHSYNRENIQELILRKREILLTKKKIEHKKQSISLLDTITTSREEEHKRAVKALEDNLIRVEKYEENLKSEAKRKADLAEKKMKDRSEKQIELNRLGQEIEMTYVMIERKNEELRHLCVFKEFVEELSNGYETNKSSTFVTANSEELYSPHLLLKGINSLETSNLFLIQQAQEAEQNLENLKSRFHNDVTGLHHQNDSFKSDIKSIEKQKEFISSKLVKMQNEKVEEPLVSEETMKLIHEALVDIYSTIGGEPGTFPTDFEILETLENSIRAEIEATKAFGEDAVRQKEKEIDKARRFKNVEALKNREAEMAKEFSERIERRKKKVVVKVGRKGMERSKIPEKMVEKVKLEIPQEILDKREFLDEYIPYP